MSDDRKQLFLVFTNPVSGREDEYNTWYDHVHLADVQRVPGITSARRYGIVPTEGPDAPPPAHRYLAVYELDAEADGNAVLGELIARAGGPELPLSEALDMSTLQMAVWRPR